ncbi:DUF2255 family protein [Agromyces aurantiacus]|uniref:DUF2255 family protein n=1 Tax=Agromyces aurantiacus TaxID=165814 RepID=A0ABV9R434_9MICO|nr:DUF2255 family protein [Agromyces aurantiacus]MBM7502948.1 hypothetical protein [Agromyces aurantiacus]
MSTWTPDELARIGGAEELRVASYRRDGTLRRDVIIWVVRAGDDLYVRSAYGPENGWYVHAKRSGMGRIRAGGVERDVAFVDVPASETATHDALDAAYRDKYRQHPASVVATVVGPDVARVTLRLEPRD